MLSTKNKLVLNTYVFFYVGLFVYIAIFFVVLRDISCLSLFQVGG